MDGQTYYTIVSNNATATSPATQYDVQLAASPADAASGNYISFPVYPTLNGVPVTIVDPATSEIQLDFNPGWVEGQTVTFQPAAGYFLGYDNSDGSLAGPLSGSYTVHNINVPTTIDSSDPYTFQLDDSSGNLVQLDDSPYFTTASGSCIRVLGFNASNSQVILNTADLTAPGFSLNSGDPLTYTSSLATTVSGLVNGTTYYAVVTPNEFATIDSANPPSIQLAPTQSDATAASTSTVYPTFTWTDASNTTQTANIGQVEPAQSEVLIGTGHSFTITSSNSATDVLTVSEIPGATVTALTEGELVVYQGAAGSAGTLQNGQIYSVHILDQSNLNAIQLQLQDVLRIPTLGELSETGGAGQSFTIGSYGTVGDVVTMGLNGTGTYTNLTEGETLTYSGAAIPGFLTNGTTYYVHILDQSDPALIQVELTPDYFITASGTLVGTGHSFSITSSDPNTGILVVSEMPGATVTSLTEGETLTYQGPAVALPGYLQDGESYTVHVVDQSDLSQIQLQLVAASPQVGSSGLLEGSGQSFSITAADSSSGTLTIAVQGQSEFDTLTEGETLTYQGPSGTGPNTLQDGQSYTVHVVDQTNTDAIQVQLYTTNQTAGYGTITASDGSSYVIHESDAATGLLTVAVSNTSEALVDGDTVTYSGASGSGAAFLQDGQTYQVIVVNQDDPENIQIELALYQMPTYGTLTGSGTGAGYDIESVDPTSQTVTLAAAAGATVPALTEGESLTFTGAALAGDGLLQNGQTYTVHIVDQSDPSSPVVQLLDPTGPYLADAASDGIDPSSNAVQIDSSGTLIPNGTIVTYHQGGPDTAIGGLQDGVSYQAVVDPSDPSTIQLVTTGANAGQTVQLTANATLVTGGGLSYTITTVNGLIQTLTVTEPQGASGPTPLTEGEAVTYNGALAHSVPGLVDGQTYYVSIPDPTYPTVIQLNDSSSALLTTENDSSSASSTTETFQPICDFQTPSTSQPVGTLSTLTPSVTGGITIEATLTSNDNLTVSTGTGDSPPILSLITNLSLGQGDSLRAKLNGPRSALSNDFNTGKLTGNLGGDGIQNTGLGSYLNGIIGVTGSYLGESISNNVVAEVGADAVLKSNSNIEVNADLKEDNLTSDSASFCKVTGTGADEAEIGSQSSNKVDVAVAVVTDSLTNTAQALIDGGSQVDAAGALSVTAQVTYPWAGPIALSGLESGWSTAAAAQVWNFLTTLADGTLGLDSLVNNWADAAAESNSDQYCISGSVNFTDYTNDCQAQIGTGALINQDPQYQNAPVGRR